MVSKEYKKVYNRLLEYEIKNGVVNEPLEDDEIELIPTLSEEDPTPTSDDSTVDDNIKVDTNDDKLDIVTKLVKLGKENIDSIFTYIEDMKNELNNINMKVNDIDSLKSDNVKLFDQVRILTPPTPLETLDKMVKISGGVSVDDYWKDYAEKRGLEKTGTLPYYQNGIEKDISDIPKPSKMYNDREIKDSFNI